MGRDARRLSVSASALALLVGVLGASGLARAETSDIPTSGEVTIATTPTGSERFEHACKAVAALARSDANRQACFGNEQKWLSARQAGTELETAARAYHALAGIKSGAPNCVAASPPPDPSVEAANTALALAKKVLDETAEASTKARALLKQHTEILAAQEKAVAAAAATTPPAKDIDTQRARLAELGAMTAGLETVASRASDEHAAAQLSFDRARNATVAAAADALEKARSKAALAAQSFAIAVDSATAGDRSPAEFERLLDDDPARLGACLAWQEEFRQAVGVTGRAAAARDGETNARSEAHRTDILRKAQAIVTGATSGNGFAEQPGSPDKLIFTVMSALGADSRTNGTQLVMTLNLSSLVERDERKRLLLPTTLRNFTVRAALPLDSTTNAPTAGAAAGSNTSTVVPAPTTGSAAATRFAVVLGSSLLDETDERLVTHDRCYDAALAYRPFTMWNADHTDSEERHDYYDICAKRAAHSQRLAWRVAMGFISPSGPGGSVVPELYAGSLVYGPTPWLYVNAFGQAIREPQIVNVAGLGLSLGANVGGKASGVDSWARLGLDLTALYSYTKSTPGTEGYSDVELRITPTVRAKILGSTIATIGVGPRILAREADHPGLLATFAVTYDADALIDQQLSSPSTLVK